MQEFLRWQMTAAGGCITSLIGGYCLNINALDEAANSWILDCYASEVATSWILQAVRMEDSVDGS